MFYEYVMTPVEYRRLEYLLGKFVSEDSLPDDEFSFVVKIIKRIQNHYIKDKLISDDSTAVEIGLMFVGLNEIINKFGLECDPMR